ncbi:PTS sugar transporter subunit IIB, partial [Clostridium perfringens]
MSTSLLVSKMIKAAKELGIDCYIGAIGEYDIKNYEKEAHILILGPQVRYLF